MPNQPRLVLGKAVPWYQGLVNFVAQILGSLLGAGLLCVTWLGRMGCVGFLWMIKLVVFFRAAPGIFVEFTAERTAEKLGFQNSSKGPAVRRLSVSLFFQDKLFRM